MSPFMTKGHLTLKRMIEINSFSHLKKFDEGRVKSAPRRWEEKNEVSLHPSGKEINDHLLK